MLRTRSLIFARVLAVLAATVVAGAAAWADPAERDHQPRSETEGQAPPSDNPSRQLDRSKGVIQPPQSIDPDMQVTPPQPDKNMPVIPPPGSPGGNQRIEPK